MKKLFPIFLVLLLSSSLLAQATIPKAKGLINDHAGLLNARDIQQLEAKARTYRDQTGNEIAVLIVETLENRPVDDFAHDVFQSWGIGSKGEDKGVLFLIAIKERKARIEVGYGLEGALTDVESGRLVNKRSPMAQAFRNGDYAGGVNAVLVGIAQAIGGDYSNPPESKKSKKGPGSFGLVFMLAWGLLMFFNRGRGGGWRSGRRSRGMGAAVLGGFMLGGGSGFGGGRGGGGGGFGGGFSGGGGASGGW